VKHLSRCLDEFTFRFDNREAEDLFGLVMLNLVIGSAIKYAELTASPPREGRYDWDPDASLGIGLIPSFALAGVGSASA
jgi:hypothetical protein